MGDGPTSTRHRHAAEDEEDTETGIDAGLEADDGVPAGAAGADDDGWALGGDAAAGRAALDSLFAVTALAPLFRLLGDPSRLSIVFVCLHEAVCVSEIARATGLSPSLVSHHLRLLRGARVVRGMRRGKQIFYTAADDHVRRMIDDMREHVVECRQDD